MIASYDNFMYVTDDPGFIWHINNGRSEPYPRELDIVKRYQSLYPSKNNICIDVGGHIGSTSFPYSRLFSRVVAYEPNKKSYDFFMQNILLNNSKNVTVHNKGAYNKTTRCTVVLHEGGNSGCYYIKEVTDDSSATAVVRLDDEFATNDTPVDFIKIDTEGSELYVLQGAREIIQKWKPLIQIETNGSALKYFGYPDELNFTFLEELGYTVFDTDGHNPFFYCPTTST